MVMKSREIILPPDILRKRINMTIQSFYEALQVYCTKLNWKCDEPKPALKELSINKIYRSNNIVTFEERSQYENGSPKEFYISYAMPSFIAEPSGNTTEFENIHLPQIGYHHTYSVQIPQRYPLGMNGTVIHPVTSLWHINFKYSSSSSDLLIAGELDGIAMNLFQQLLWNPEVIYDYGKEQRSAVNNSALHFANIHGREFPFKVLKELMREKYHLAEN